MDADLSKLPTGTVGWLALTSYAVSLGDLSELDYLELKGGLQFSTPRDRKRSAVVVGRAILGMSNRMPDIAHKHLGGAGVILIGIDKGSVIGAEQIDGAVLRDVIQPYLGVDGPDWDHQFVVHPEGLILAVIVDPPRWGDSIHTCRKDYSDDTQKLAVRDGEVFVRIPGKTRAASSHDIAQLEKRRLKAPHTDAQVRVFYGGSFDRISKENIHELMGEEINDAVSGLLAEVPEPRPGGIYGASINPLLGSSARWTDSRGVEGFRAEVEEWRDACRDQFGHLTDEFLRFTLTPGNFVLANQSDRYLEMVRVRVTFEPHASVPLTSDTDYCHHGGEYFRSSQLLPKRPVKYGAYHGFDVSSLAVPSTEQSSAGCGRQWS